MRVQTEIYRPRSDDAAHVYLFFLTAAVFLLAGGLDMALRPYIAMRPGALHLACLAGAGVVGFTLVFEVRPVVRRARAVAALVLLADAAAIFLRLAGWRYPVAAILCFCVSAMVAISAIIGMRGPHWQAYCAYVAGAGFLAL